MEFCLAGQQVKLQGEKGIYNQEIQLHQLRRLTTKKEVAYCYQLISITSDSQHLVAVPPKIQELLEEFKHVFESPKQLPPQRHNDHQIYLQTETASINVKPYRYPHYQKSEIEKLVKEMLESGVIRPSHSPFSSPVLLVKKKDGTWRFCSTTKRCFPMDTEAQNAFEALKVAVTKAPVLSLPDFKKPFVVETWEEITMDFIIGLPSLGGKTVIMVVVDRLSKYAHFSALHRDFSANKVASIFVADICHLHGIPKSIVTDRDKVFMSIFWRELFRLSGTKLHYSTAYHPETNGQTEVTNRGLEQYLRCFTMESPTAWLTYLPWAELSYNTSYHSAIGCSPFQVLYGRLPPPIHSYEDNSTSVEAVDVMLSQRDAMLRQLKENLHRTRHRMKQQADKKRRDLQFKVGDRVLVKLQPYRQSSLKRQTYSKLRRRYYGPYEILERVGSVAYRLALPNPSRIHPVFHVSLLKPYKQNPRFHPTQLPEGLAEGQPLVQPLAILRKRMVHQESRVEEQLLVQWEGWNPEDSTWIPTIEFRRAYPQFDLEDKVDLPRRKEIDTDLNAVTSEEMNDMNEVIFPLLLSLHFLLFSGSCGHPTIA
ncbi:putative mitochondrial protein [Apostasia shenzhenica]|uniref:Putative mitochondrial protein n=1 Tax=Apostasia shenzhenica TaxID=1088818 RepID=A0A2I0B9L4_9ASPA|nr:putative mitochondrial protein [Apostasia shenzhenica]